MKDERKFDDQPSSPWFVRVKRLMRLPAHKKEEVPWLWGSVEYGERYWSLTREAWRWRIAFTVSLAANAVLCVCLTIIATSSRVIPYIVQVDKHGYAIAIKPAERGNTRDERTIIHSVSAWIRAMRSVRGDEHAQQLDIETTYKFLAAGSPATTKANAWFRAHNPLEGSKRQVDVQIERVLFAGSSKSLSAEWTETERQGAEVLSVSRFSAFVKVTFSPSEKFDDFELNPLGIFVTDFSITQLQ